MIKLNYFFIFSFIFLSYACNNSQNEMDDLNKITFVNPLEEIGKLHNKALDSIRINSINLNSLDEYTHNLVESEWERKYNVPSEPLYTHTINMMKNAKNNGIKLEYSELSRSNSIMSDSLKNTIPTALYPYIEDMFTLIDKNMFDSVEIENEFYKIDLSINENIAISVEDKNMLWAVSSIIKYSYMYNLQEISSRSVTAESLLQADAEGAIGGLLTWKFWGKTVASGLVFGPTGAVVAATKEIVKGAIVGSGVHVALHVWD